MSAHVKAVKSTAEDVATKAAQAHGMQHAATASLEGLPAEMVAVVAAHAGFFDRAKLDRFAYDRQMSPFGRPSAEELQGARGDAAAARRALDAMAGAIE